MKSFVLFCLSELSLSDRFSPGECMMWAAGWQSHAIQSGCRVAGRCPSAVMGEQVVERARAHLLCLEGFS